MMVCARGRYDLCTPPLDDVVSTWFVLSRKRLVYGATSASAMRFPSGDQVGVPGCASVSWTFVTVPLATSSTEIWATRHIPSTLKNAMRVPSGDQVAPCGCVVRYVTWRLYPVRMSRIQSCRCSLSLSDE